MLENPMVCVPDLPSDVSRPRLAFRVGITGARKLQAGALPGLRSELTQVLGTVQAWLLDLAQSTEAAPPLLRMISPLAEGADRLAAEMALQLGYQLEAPLPFPAAEYEKDFPETVAGFRRLLAAAGPHVLPLNGARGDAETRSYEAVGRLVVAHCDLLLAIWDGGKSRGRGGTAEIVQFAARQKLPIWWIPADGVGAPGWLIGEQAALQPVSAPQGEAAMLLLQNHLRMAAKGLGWTQLAPLSLVVTD